MKRNSLILGVATLAALGSLAGFNFGCGKPAAPTRSVIALPSERTSFAEVSDQLDPGGNFYLYLGTAQWLEHLSTTVEQWRTTLTALPALPPDKAADVNQAFDAVNRLIQDSGVQDLSGVGLSSVEVEKGMFHNKMFLHHYPKTGNGFLWKLSGRPPHPLTGLDLLPANTALAVFTDLDLPLTWKVLQDEISKAGYPQADDFLQNLPAQFEQRTQLKWEAMLKSLGGEYGFALTLNEANPITLPLPTGALTIPEPGLFVVLKVNDDLLFDRIDEALKANPQTIKADQAGLKLRTMPVPLPLIGTLRPSAASSGGYLFIASSDALVKEALAVKSGKSPGLTSTAEFKRLAKLMPDQGNGFSYMGASFGKILFQIQQQALSGPLAQGGNGPAQAKLIQSLFNSQPAFAYTVTATAADGVLSTGNGSQSFANLALLPAVAVPAMMSAIAIPNFVKARTTAQKNACINNLRQLDAAENQWALENNKKTGAPCTANDLKPYLKLVNGQMPKCPQDGSYSIHAVGEAPTCSIADHQLP